VYRATGTGPGGRGVPKDAVVVAGRIEDYAELRGRGLTVAQAAERLGISDRTGTRYEARLRAEREMERVRVLAEVPDDMTVESLYDTLPGEGAA
jgi:hypothetical protein